MSVESPRVAEIEQHWGGLVGHAKFDEVCYLLDKLLRKLTTAHDERAGA